MIELELHVSTPDAAAEQEPYRISDQPDHNTVHVAVTPTSDGGAVIGAVRVVFDGGERAPQPPARLVANRGAVCGLNRCGARGVLPLAAPSGREMVLVFRYPDTGGPPDGTYDVSVHVGSETEGWA